MNIYINYVIELPLAKSYLKNIYLIIINIKIQ